ncbi:MAG: archaellin/type IV pilin N-terminal domain-containing protein [Candidatus Thorarchaeota archaeon]
MKLIQNIPKKRRAVSPILAAILLIGLAITAGAVLFVVVLPLITAPGSGLVFDSSTTELTANSVHIVLRNEGSEIVTVTNISVKSSTYTAVINTTFNSFSIGVGQGAIKDYTFATGLSPGLYTIEATYYIGTDTTNTGTATLKTNI